MHSSMQIISVYQFISTPKCRFFLSIVAAYVLICVIGLWKPYLHCFTYLFNKQRAFWILFIYLFNK